MPRSHMLKSLIHVRDAFCVPCLVLLALSELYSAVDLSLDSRQLPAWEHPIGWGLFVLLTALVLGMLLLLRLNWKMLGFNLAGASLLFYALFVCVEAFQAPMELGDWMAMFSWCGFCALGIGAAGILMVRPRETTIAEPIHSERSE